ncbi:alpha/beta fold hydrolase [Agrilutibacter solisilvae]|uniref:Alpha/beta fold hydrolase n=1 Tax=Agrilutibacter solisilvae TaxID=2763317 RepID=A0A975ASR9_9GAMM|nr:alpha/beta fold hydrolase [Lysobacter solisilvae]QSX78354.1 alpha/beta fold hydrolase [Lysobacter solisilvae]
MPACRHALLLHGAGGGGWEWNRWHGALAAHGITVAAPDLQPAAAGLAATTLADYVEQARAALDALPRPRAVIGASLGGLLAWACAEAADALVLVNPLPPAPWASRLPSREWPAVVPWGCQARLSSTRRAIPDADPATALYAMRHWRDESGAVLRAAHEGLALPPPSVPVLCVVSAADEDVPPALTRALAQALPATLLEADSPSHAGPLLGMGANGLADRVARWLSGV